MTTTQLPESYREIGHIDLQKDKKLALLVNGLALVIIIPLGILGVMRQPIPDFFSGKFLPLLAVLPCFVLYIILHELVHGIFMKAFSGQKPHYGFTLLYAYAGSGAYFDRTHYLIIALAPVVIWGAVLLVVCALVPPVWFWTAYLIQILNLSGAAGDFYATYRMLFRLPANVLTQDTGVAMTFFIPEE